MFLFHKSTLNCFIVRKMWSPVISPPDVPDDKVPVSRCKHATVLHGQCLYLLGGRNGNLPMKDFWKYCIGKQNLNLNCLQYDKFPNNQNA